MIEQLIMLTVGLSEAAITEEPNYILSTEISGPSIAVCFFDPSVKVGGMLHFQKPSFNPKTEQFNKGIYHYADSGTQTILFNLMESGAEWDRLIIKVCTGPADPKMPDEISVLKRNFLALRKFLWKYGLMIKAQHTGLGDPFQMKLSLLDGTVTVKVNEHQRFI